VALLFFFSTTAAPLLPPSGFLVALLEVDSSSFRTPSNSLSGSAGGSSLRSLGTSSRKSRGGGGISAVLLVERCGDGGLLDLDVRRLDEDGPGSSL
jgi:hypothetical protein